MYKGKVVAQDNFKQFYDELTGIFKRVKNGRFEGVLKTLAVISDGRYSGTGGFLNYFKVIGKNMVGQEDSLSCAIACLRQLAKDKGILLSEDKIRKYAGIVKGNPTYEEEMSAIAEKIFKGKKVDEGILGYLSIPADDLINILT